MPDSTLVIFFRNKAIQQQTFAQTFGHTSTLLHLYTKHMHTHHTHTYTHTVADLPKIDADSCFQTFQTKLKLDVTTLKQN